MRKTLVWMTVLLLLWAPFTQAAGESLGDNAPETVISEGSFLYQLNLMQSDPAAYAGQTVEIEGVFGAFHYGGSDEPQLYYQIYRYTPGSCCGAYITGLEVYLPEPDAVYPADDTWVRAQGVLETYELDGITYLQARLTQLEETDEEGNRLVFP